MTKLKIKWSLYARQSLNLIVDYIKLDSPANAKIVKKKLIFLAGTLNEIPKKFPKDTYLSKNKGDFRFACI